MSGIEAAYQRIQHEEPEGWAEYLGKLDERQLRTASRSLTMAN